MAWVLEAADQMGLQDLRLGWTLRRVLDLARFLHSLQEPWGLQTTLQRQLALGSFLSHCSVLSMLRVSWVRCQRPSKRCCPEHAVQTVWATRLVHGLGPERFPTAQAAQDQQRVPRNLLLEMRLALGSCLYRCLVLPKSCAAWAR